MRKGWQWMLLAMIGPLLISGCEPTQILDETTLITVMGFDVLEDNRIRATASAPVVSSLVSQKEQVVSATDTTLNGIMNKLDLQLDRRPKLGQLRIALYSKEMAKKGMIEFVGVMDRVEVGLRPYLGIVDGKSYDLVQADYPTQGNIGLYLYYTIYKNVRGEQLPSSTLHEFMRDYYSEGNDPYLPFIERKGNDINIKGVALFKGGQYVDWVKPEQAFYIKLVRDQFRAGFFQLSIPTAGLGIQDQRKSNKQETSPIALETINSKKNIKLVSQHPPTFDVSVEIKARLDEMGNKPDLENTEIVKKIEREVDRKMEKEMRELVALLQKKGVDPMGFGEHYRSQTRSAHFEKEKWREMYKQAKFRFHVKTQIIRLSITD